MPKAKSPTPPSTPRLSEVARHVVIPTGIVTTAWPRVEAKLADLGVTFDRWQSDGSKLILGKRADGSFAASVGGVCLSIPRQVGKTFLVGMIVVALCLLHPGLTVVWPAHRTRTATKTFQTLKGMTARPKVAPYMLEPRNANGEQEIRFRNGSVIMFGAREQGFGRGFDKVDIAVFDEAQILSERGVEDIVPATNQAEMDGGALLFFMGTPPRPGDPGEEFTNRRTAAINGKTEDMVYIEFSADSDADLDDHKQWRKANPSFPSRTPVASMKRMRANLTDDDSYRREALGIWDEVEVDNGLSVSGWNALADATAAPSGELWLAADVAPGHGSASVVVVGDDVLELIVRRPAASWLPEFVAGVRQRQGITTPLAYDPAGPIGSLVPEFERLGVPLHPVDGKDSVRALGSLVAAVTDKTFRHRGEPEFVAAVAGAKRRAVGDGHKWSRKDSSVDISPLVAATVALWVARSAEPEIIRPTIHFI